VTPDPAERAELLTRARDQLQASLDDLLGDRLRASGRPPRDRAGWIEVRDADVVGRCAARFARPEPSQWSDLTTVTATRTLGRLVLRERDPSELPDATLDRILAGADDLPAWLANGLEPLDRSAVAAVRASVLAWVADALTPDALFRYGNLVALAGWLTLGLGIALRSPRLRDTVAGLAVPLGLSVAYTAIIMVHWWSGEGGFSSLQDVNALFRSPWLLLAGWVHYLAFDLFVGAWIARDAEAHGLPRLLLVPVLPVVFLFGPAGLLLWLCLRTAFGTLPARSSR